MTSLELAKELGAKHNHILRTIRLNIEKLKEKGENISRITINRYLKKGSKIGLCSYNPKEEQIKNGIKNGKKLVL